MDIVEINVEANETQEMRILEVVDEEITDGTLMDTTEATAAETKVSKGDAPAANNTEAPEQQSEPEQEDYETTIASPVVPELVTDIIFPNSSIDTSTDAMTNFKWLSTTGSRKLKFSGNVSRLAVEKTGIFGLRTTDVYHARKLCIYEHPPLILLLRAPDATEIATHGGDSFLVAETVVDPKACKLRLSTLTTITSIENTAIDPRRRTCFEILTPTDSIVLTCIPSCQNHMALVNSVAFLETKKMEVAIGNALYDAHCLTDGQVDITWKHQLILGTLHSYVITGSQSLLDQAIRAAGGRVPSHVIDAVDESGRTALHYACARRNAAAVAVLIGAGCDATGSNDKSTPCHLSAAMLDEMSLSTILSAPRRPDPNALDEKGRTPMYVAIVEGRGVDKACDVALGHCLQALEVWGGQMIVPGSRLPHPVVLLASEWKWERINAVMAHVPFRYPLRTPGISVGALYHYPIHTAILSLRRKICSVAPGDQAFRISDSERQNLTRTLSLLLQHGFEPNERIEGSLQSSTTDENLGELFGFSPVHLLALSALDLVVLKSTKIGAGVEDNIANVIAACADKLLTCGARLNLDPPPTSRLSRPSTFMPRQVEPEGPFPIDRQSLKIESNKEIMNIFGGDLRIKPAKKLWLEMKTAKSTGKMFIQQDIRRTETANSDAPGGSDEKSCAICWAAFGMILHRKHRCRVTQRYVCEDCSTKRITEGGEEHRLSDGQFLLATSDEVRQREDAVKQQQEEVRELAAQRRERQEKLQAKMEEEKAKKDSLFGGMMEQLGFGEEDTTLVKVDSLQSSLGQTRDALNQRGDKLSSLSEKTEKLMDASSEFERMAKELERSQSGGFFW